MRAVEGADVIAHVLSYDDLSGAGWARYALSILTA